MSNLYMIAREYRELESALYASVDEETGEVSVDIAEAVGKIQRDFNQKAIAIATVWRGFGNYVSEIKAEIDRLTALKKRVEREQTRLTDYLTQACEMTGTTEVRGVSANISFRNSPPRTVIDDESAIPEQYIAVKTERKPNLTAIKEAIKAGKEVPGAHLEAERKICIK